MALRHRPQCGPVDEPCSRDATQVAESRQTRLDNAGCALGQKQGPYPDEAEHIIQTSTSIYPFARGVYDLETISQALASVGIGPSEDKLRAMGQRIHWERIRLRECLDFRVQLEDVPRRFFKMLTPRGRLELRRLATMPEIFQARRSAVLG